MRLRKKTLFLIGYALLLVALLGYLVFDVQRVWKNEQSWDRTSVVGFDTNTKAIEVTTLNDSEKELTIPYCALSKITTADNGEVDWTCSFQPWYITKLQGYNYDAIRLNDDFVLHLDFNKSPLPSKYLEYTTIDKSVFGEKHVGLPIPVSVKLRISEKSEKYTILSALSHYIMWITGRKDVVSQKVLSWEVSRISEDSGTMSDTQLQQIITKLSDSVDKHLSIDSINDEDNVEFLDSLALMFKEQTYLCFTDEAYCNYDVEGNAGSNIINYLYVQNRLGKKDFVNKFLRIARQRVSPFAEQQNKDFEIVYPPNCTVNSTDPDCLGHYQDLQVYQYPICPIREINESNLSHDNVKLFKEVMKLYTEKNGVIIFKQGEVLSKLQALENLEPEKLPIFLSDKNVMALNQLCYAAVAYNMTTEKSVRDTLTKAYVSVLGTTFSSFTGIDLAYKTPKTLEDLKQFVYQTKLQATRYPLVPHERYHEEKIIEGLSDRTDLSLLNTTVTSLPLTLTLIYLFAK